jgi:uncharacterized protein with NAD-binding domain and iron-sulfur cluster
MNCVVLGAGIAGLVAALELQKRGVQVSVIEAAALAGGRTCSWLTPSGLETGTGLHVVADHYTNLLDVLASVDALNEIVWWNEHSYLRPGEPRVLWRYNRLPAPFHLLNPAAAMPLVLGSKIRFLLASLDAARYRQEDLHLLDDISYLEWHNRHKLGAGFILDLATLAADAATFLPLQRVAAHPVLSWLKYMSRSSQAGRIGTWRRPLSDGLVAPLTNALKKFGGTIRTSTEAVRICTKGNTVRGVIVRDCAHKSPHYQARGEYTEQELEQMLHCDTLISALPVQALKKVLDSDTAERADLTSALTLATVPAISVVVRFDRKIHPNLPGAPLVTGCMIRDFIDLSEFRDGLPVSLIQFLVSRSEEWMGESDDRIVSAVARDFCVLWPAATAAKVADAAVERIPSAMFAAHPGSHRLRPPTETKIPNFFLAGDWIRHDLNASMEGAALSGRLAARAVLRKEKRDSVPMLRPDEPLVNRALQFLAGPSSALRRVA